MLRAHGSRDSGVDGLLVEGGWDHGGEREKPRKTSGSPVLRLVDGFGDSGIRGH